eukprot:s557_g2.t1
MATGHEQGGISSPLPPTDDEEVEDFNGRGTRTRGRGPRLPTVGVDEEEQFRMFQRFLDNQRRPRLRNEESDGETGQDGRGSSGPPPEWDGQGAFEDYLIRARLWIATTKTKAVARGPLLLKALKGPPFESFKYLAKDSAWLSSSTNAEDLLKKMDAPDQYGEDQEEHLLASLSRITFHLKRSKQETWREFFSRWEGALRKVKEHKVELPEPYLGFLLIHGLRLEDQEIRAMLTFTHGDIQPKSIKAWLRKHESKLTVNQLGAEGIKKSTNAVMYNEVDDDETPEPDEEIAEIENLLSELHDGDREGEPLADDEVLSEKEAAEILATLLEKKKKKTFYQSMKAKKQQELSRGYGNRPNGSIRFGRDPRRNGESGGGRGLTIQEIKLRTRCGICKKIGHWHRECPSKEENKTEKEAHHLMPDYNLETSSEVHFCGMLETEEGLVTDFDMETIKHNLKGLKLTEKDYQVYESEDEKYQARDKTYGSSSDFCRTLETDISRADQPALNFSHHQPTGGFEDRPDQTDREAYMSAVAELFFFENMMIQSCKKNSVKIHEDSCATLDTGCQRLAIGMETLKRMLPFIPETLHIHLVNSVNRFRSVHGTSTTHRLAVIPSSLGHKGSILRPAIFEDEHGKDAPFLLSLPLLLHGGSTIFLDSHSGLFLRLGDRGEKIACHLGPTGALRVPVCQFTSTKINCLIRDMAHLTRAEFDVLTTSLDTGANHASASVVSGRNHPSGAQSHRSTPSDDHGGCYEATSKSDYVQRQGCLAEAAPEALGIDHPSDAHCRTSSTTGRPIDGRGVTNQSEPMEPGVSGTIQKGAEFITSLQPNTQRDHIDHQGEHPQPGPSRTDLRFTRTGSADGTSSQMSLQSVLQDVHELHGGSQQREGLLALPQNTGSTTMPVFPLDRLPAHAGPECMALPRRRGRQASYAKGSGAEIDPEGMPTYQDLEEGDEPARREGDLPHLREGAQDCRQEGQEAVGSRESAGEPRSTIPERDGAVPTVPSLAEIPAKLHRQVKQSLRKAISFWKTIQELFSFHGVDDETTSRKLQSLHQEIVSDLKAHPRGSKRIQQVAEAMHLSIRSLRTVAEIYNPGCFSKFAKQHGLEPGIAFDLTLGHDLSCPKKRAHVIEYIKTVRPGLTLIAPPCHLYSQLQNLLKELREQDPEAMKRYISKRRKAQVLLNFAVEVAELCRELGLIFVLEHPWSAQSWQTKVLEKLIAHEDVFVSRADQCMFGLKNDIGDFHRKRTGFATNHLQIAQVLNQHCTGKHQHDHVIGGSKSRRAQVYPDQLLHAILHAYSKTIQHKINLLTSEEILNQDCRFDQWFTEHSVNNDAEPKTDLFAMEGAGADDSDYEPSLAPDHLLSDQQQGEPALQHDPEPGHDDEQRGGPDDEQGGGLLPRQRPLTLKARRDF